MNSAQGHDYRRNDGAARWPQHVAPREQHAEAAVPDLRGDTLATAARRELAIAWAACGAFEWVALGYLAASSALIVIFARNLAHPLLLLCLQALLAVVILALCGFEARVANQPAQSGATFEQRFWHFWRHWYPHLFFLFCFEELGHMVHLVTPNWQDAKLIAFDYWLTGVHPAVWLEQFGSPARNDFMQFAYLTYFTYLLVLGGILYYRQEWRAYWSVMTYSAVGYAIGYIIAVLFPVESPWFAMAGFWQGELHGGPFTATINFIEHYGRVRGAAFPSEHVAGSFAVLWGAWRHKRWLFWIMVPPVFIMCASTVYGRYHYLADVFAGMITGTLGYAIGKWIMRRQGAVAGKERVAGAPSFSQQKLPG